MKRNPLSGFFGVSYLLFQPYLGGLERLFGDFRNEVPRSGLRLTYRAYIAGTILASGIASVAAAVAAFGYAFYVGLPILAMSLLTAGAFVLGFAVTFTVFYFYPSIRASSRKNSLEGELPYLMGHMAVLAAAGVTPEQIFRTVAEEKDMDKVTREEAGMVVRDMNLLGMDLTQALEAEKRRSPSPLFAQFLDGLVSVAQSGSDAKAYLERSASSILVDMRLKAKNVGENVGVVAELYTIVLVVTPLVLLIMFSVIGLIAGSLGGIGVLTLTYAVAYLFVPIGAFFTLILADRLIGKEAG